MMSDTLDDQAVRNYLERLERGLHLLPKDERAAIILEIKSHIAERLAEPDTTIHFVLDSLGDADELAHSYVEHYRLEDALARSSLSLLVVILKRAARSVVALVTGFVAVSFYLFALGFVWVAVVKPIFPQTTGMWFEGGHFNFGSFSAAPGTHELLGYWIIPVAVAGALISYVAGTALMRLGGRLLLRSKPALAAA